MSSSRFVRPVVPPPSAPLSFVNGAWSPVLGASPVSAQSSPCAGDEDVGMAHACSFYQRIHHKADVHGDRWL